MSAITVTIDAGVLAVPDPNGTAADAHRYVETILDWSKLIDDRWVAICMSERASEVLFDDNLYPMREPLKRLFATQGIVEYDVNTVAPIVDRLLQLTPSFETYFSIEDVLVENLSLEPDVRLRFSGSGLLSDLARCLVLIAVLRDRCPQEASGHSLILRSAQGTTVRVRAQIHQLEHSREDLEGLPTAPEYFDGEALVCEDFAGLIDCLNEPAILVRAADDIGVEAAIRVAFYKTRLRNRAAPDWDDVPSFRIGRCFRALMQAIHPTEQLAARMLRAIVETLANTNMADTHALRTGAGGGDAQRTRGKDKAWRRDIDYEYHLHYWQCADGTVELASVVVHNDFSIPE